MSIDFLMIWLIVGAILLPPLFFWWLQARDRFWEIRKKENELMDKIWAELQSKIKEKK